MSAALIPAAQAFAERARELDRAQRRRLAPFGGAPSSFIGRWLGGLFVRRRPSATVSAPIALPAPGECSITLLGHSTAVIRYARGRVLTDPCFARSLGGLRRARPSGLPPGALEGLDVVLISHAHADHLHRPSLERIDRSATLIVPPRCKRADGLGFARVVELQPGATFAAGGIEVTAVPAQHRVGLLGREAALGYVIAGDGPTVYFAGDTGYFPGFAEVGARFGPEVALLPISGYRPRALRRDHLSPLDAVYAFEDLGAQLLVPVHHSTFALGYEPLQEPLEWLRELEAARGLEQRIAWLDPGASCVARRTAASANDAEAPQTSLQTGKPPASLPRA